ncbi:MAG: succinylglutamate desuccinylase/aspartoacylase family protein [Candidatus Brocadiia bacterium]
MPEKTRSFIETPDYRHGIRTRIPVLSVTGTQDRPHLVCVAAQHGRELNGVAAIADVFDQLDPDRLRGTVTFLPVMNPPAVITQQQDFPTEVMRFRNRPGITAEYNVNRCWEPEEAPDWFCGQVTALVRETLLHGADALLDLHAWSPRQIPLAWAVPEHIALARAFGLPHFHARQPDHPGKSHAAGEALGIPTVVVELSGQSAVYLDALRTGVRGILNLLRHLDMLDGELELPPVQHHLSDERCHHHTEVEGLLVPHMRPGDPVRCGDVLGRIISLETLEMLQPLTSDRDGICYRIGANRWGEDLLERGVVYPGQVVAIVAGLADNRPPNTSDEDRS